VTALEASAAGGESFDLLQADRQIQRRDTRRRVTKSVGWASLVAFSISRGGVLGWAVAAGGVYGLVHELLDWRESRPEWKKHAAHAPHGVVGRLLAHRPRDAVDNQSKLSFPASDPPAGSGAG
jgi:hypothetical protein